jgi:RNA-directed DNA polymerase
MLDALTDRTRVTSAVPLRAKQHDAGVGHERRSAAELFPLWSNASSVINILPLKAKVKHRVPCSPTCDCPFELEITFCVRGVISPLLANLYMNRFLKYWRITVKGELWKARIITYADDFVILSRGHAKEALEWTRGVMQRLELTLNEAKTSIKDARQEKFDFLGYSFGPHCYRKKGTWYRGASPSKKSQQRVKEKVDEVLKTNLTSPWDEIRTRLNQTLRGWAAYFSHGTRTMAYRAVDNHVYESVRHFLRRGHKVPTRGTRRFSGEKIFGKLGVIRLRDIQYGARP